MTYETNVRARVCAAVVSPAAADRPPAPALGPNITLRNAQMYCHNLHILAAILPHTELVHIRIQKLVRSLRPPVTMRWRPFNHHTPPHPHYKARVSVNKHSHCALFLSGCWVAFLCCCIRLMGWGQVGCGAQNLIRAFVTPVTHTHTQIITSGRLNKKHISTVRPHNTHTNTHGTAWAAFRLGC